MLYKGTPVCAGYARGSVYQYRPFICEVEKSSITDAEISSALSRWQQIRIDAAAELEEIRQRLSVHDAEKAKVFSAHIEILNDEAIAEEIEAAISEENAALDWAIATVFERFIHILSKTADPLIRERTADLQDVKLRLLRLERGIPERNLSALSGPVVVVAHDLLPSDTATIDRDNVLAILTETGGPTSHTAIIARSYAIPAILGLDEISSHLADGETVLVDAVCGTVLSDPTEEALEAFSHLQHDYLQKQQSDAAYLAHPCATADGIRISIGMNVGALNDAERELVPCCDFAGLFRTEFLYMDAAHLPTEEEQYRAYRATLEAFAGKPVTLRTLDIGGDKTLPYFPLPQEDNPFLGNRALRLCLTHLDLFLTQLRAALRAAQFGDLWLMFPMVGSISDIHRALDALNDARTSLERDGLSYGACKVGIMVEIPAIALLAKEAAALVDFASIGTNDLCQYLSAADRQNPQVEPYYQQSLPAVLRMIAGIVRDFGDKPLSVCGEMGGDRLLAPVLAGLGLHKLSMSAARIAGVKHVLAEKTLPQLQGLAQHALALPTAEEIRAYLEQSL